MSVDCPLAGRLLRLGDIVRPARAQGGKLSLVPVSAASWWQGITEGRFPPPLKPTPATSAWRGEYLELVIRHAGTDWLDIVAMVMTTTTNRYDAIRELLSIDYGSDIETWLADKRAAASTARHARVSRRKAA